MILMPPYQPYPLASDIVCSTCNIAVEIKENRRDITADVAMELGADIIKMFPGEAFGPKIIKAIKGPLPQANIMPTGGVNIDNVGEWIKAGAVAVGVGGSLTAGAKTGDYDEITRLAAEFTSRIKEARA
jgi:2-keto-3-deoxy-6-phosphogluconate aldolase